MQAAVVRSARKDSCKGVRTTQASSRSPRQCDIAAVRSQRPAQTEHTSSFSSGVSCGVVGLSSPVFGRNCDSSCGRLEVPRTNVRDKSQSWTPQHSCAHLASTRNVFIRNFEQTFHYLIRNRNPLSGLSVSRDRLSDAMWISRSSRQWWRSDESCDNCCDEDGC
jgi:hypothetical protein